jgi:hypothetical protein
VNAPGVNVNREQSTLRSRLSSAGVIVHRDGWVEAMARPVAPRSEPLTQCMGGWCQKRERCAHYGAPMRFGREPIERMCGPVDTPVQA